jgi:hypothetical protein
MLYTIGPKLIEDEDYFQVLEIPGKRVKDKKRDRKEDHKRLNTDKKNKNKVTGGNSKNKEKSAKTNE